MLLSGNVLVDAGYKFALLLHDVASDSQKLFSELSNQCRSVFYDWRGQFQLLYLPDSVPPADITLDPSTNIVGFPQMDFSPRASVINLVNIYYRLDYRGKSDPSRLSG